MNTAPVIEIDRLTKFYGTREIVRDLCLNVPAGSIYGFLGRNGMGKTTTIRILLGMEEPTRGRTRVFGEDSSRLSPETRARIGYLPEGHHVYGWMTVRECGKFQASFFPKWNQDVFEAVITHFRLTPKMKAGHLSRGQRAGLCLALTLAPEPELLVLDDPALGLDPVARRSLLQSMLYVTRQPHRTILFSSHLLSDEERVADRIVVLDGGGVRADCTVETFRQRLRHYVLKFRDTPPAPPPVPGLLESFRTDRELLMTLVNVTPEVEAQLAALQPESMEPMDMTLEDAFVSYVGERGEKTFFTHQRNGHQ
ncbi:MAG: ABC transporter ATP-binding protein [Chthoniobacter sp.]|uniref:ABC transporter ATP-binding protein n=1 Tax=Chthoniobacter sp. TaxID=2510640 RepID=UPI0032A31881